MGKNEVTVFLRFGGVKKLYECSVNLSGSFTQILETLRPMIQNEFAGYLDLNRKLTVFFCHDGSECDPDVSLRSLGVQDGMSFFII